MRNTSDKLEFFFQKLSNISTFKCTAESASGATKTLKHSQAVVKIQIVNVKTLIYCEEGSWIESATNFKNTLRWTIDKKNQQISLEHLRRGKDKAVFLFYFVLNGPNKLTALAPHFCEPDTYKAEIKWNNEYIEYQCRISGPKKEDLLTYRYE